MEIFELKPLVIAKVPHQVRLKASRKWYRLGSKL
ncbi:hypothetical protein V6Z12_D01G154700 [Gossypium hirsutum]